MDVFAYQYMDGLAYKKKNHDYDNDIPFKKMEKVLVSNSGYPATSVIFLLMSPYKQVVNELHDIIFGQIGANNVVEKRTNEVAGYSNGSEKYIAMVTVDLAKFKAYNINIEDFKESSFDSKKYNIINEKTYSVLSLRIADGQDVFGVNCTLVYMHRLDYSRGWLREFHTGIPIPIRGDGTSSVITNTEVNIIEQLKQKMSIKNSAYFFPNDERQSFSVKDMMLEIRKTVDEFNKGKE
ncbi:hypothetical protein EPN18_06210 [bacterium]|nr:MAG: hypothetical protein EPN18_06210 [bacterium]